MPTTHASIARENLSRRKDITGELRQIDEAATADKRSYTEDEAAKIEALTTELDQIDKRITTNLDLEIRQREIEGATGDLLGLMLAQDDGDRVDLRTVGRRLSDAPEYRAWADQGGQAGHLRVSSDLAFRAVTDASLASGSAGTMVVTPRLPGVRMGDTLDEMPTLIDLVPHIPVSQAAVEYVQDITDAADLVNRPAFVPEGGLKPDAAVTLGVITEPIKTVAVMHHITRQAAADVPQFMGYVDGRLRYALRRKADREVLSGTGASNGLVGLLNRSGINTYAPGSAEARYRSIRRGITLMEQDETVPEVVVLNPQDAEYFDLSNDTTAGLHAADANGGIRTTPARTAWGLRQVRSNAVAAGTAVLLDPTAMAVFDRQAITAYTTDAHGENFAYNILSLLLEARLGVGLFQPQGVCKITFNGTA